MKQFIFTERSGIHIIDLNKTLKQIDEAYNAVRRAAQAGRPILFVGTKKQAMDIVKQEAERCGMFYVTERWLGGMLTNWQTISQNIRHLDNLDRLAEDGEVPVVGWTLWPDKATCDAAARAMEAEMEGQDAPTSWPLSIKATFAQGMRTPL